MSGEASRGNFAARPRDADAWVREAERRGPRADQFSARLTVDVTPALRGRIKIAAFQRGQTVADMLRAMLEDAFPKVEP